jgi:hypothetical protein
MVLTGKQGEKLLNRLHARRAIKANAHLKVADFALKIGLANQMLESRDLGGSLNLDKLGLGGIGSPFKLTA